MTAADDVVRQLLDSIEKRIDLDHVAQLRARHRAALNYEPLEIPPLVICVPYEGTDFSPYPYPEAFADPAKMMANELLLNFTSIYHAVDLKDDAPYCLRPNLGTVIIASMFGAQVRLVEDNMPWAAPLGSLKKIQQAIDGPLPDIRSGLGQRVGDQYAYFHEALRDYPRCRAAFEITLPDLQGPFDTAELLWGSSIFPDLFEQTSLLHRLLDRITRQMLRVYRFCQGMTRESLQLDAHWQHACAFRGKLLLRDDSVILMSPGMYRDIVMPFDAHLAHDLGGIGIHFCGNGQHQIDNMLSIEGLQSLDIGQPEMMDMDAIYARAAGKCVPLVRVSVPAQELTAARVRARFPAGVIMTYKAGSVADARRAWEHYTGMP